MNKGELEEIAIKDIWPILLQYEGRNPELIVSIINELKLTKPEKNTLYTAIINNLGFRASSNVSDEEFKNTVDYYNRVYEFVDKYVKDEKKVNLLIDKVGLANLIKLAKTDEETLNTVKYSVRYGKYGEYGRMGLLLKDLFSELLSFFGNSEDKYVKISAEIDDGLFSQTKLLFELEK